MDTALGCVLCRRPLEGRARCRACNTPVLHAGPVPLHLPSPRASLELLRRALESSSSSRHDRWLRGVLGRLPTTRLSELESLQARTEGGWSVEQLHPFLAGDWTSERRRDVAVLAAWARRYAPLDAQALVLGCGGGGLVATLAERFARVTGVDLSIPALLVAHRLLAGGTVPTTGGRGQAVRLRGQRRSTARLMAASASHLPFEQGAVGTVATQYLLDLVPRPRAVALEIRRVLRDGGLWLNAGSVFDDDLASRGPTIKDRFALAIYLRRAGFELLEAEFPASSRARWSALAPAEDVLWFAARARPRSRPIDTASAAVAAYFRGEQDALMTARCILPLHQTSWLLRGSSFHGGRARPAAELHALRQGKLGRLALSERAAQTLERVLLAAVRERRLGEVRTRAERTGVSAREFGRAVRFLIDFDCVDLAP